MTQIECWQARLRHLWAKHNRTGSSSISEACMVSPEAHHTTLTKFTSGHTTVLAKKLQ